MTKEQFMKELSELLTKVSEHDRKEILADIEEHFEMATMEGKTEEEICQSLGSPKTIAKDFLLDYRIQQAENEKSVKNLSQAVMATVGLSFFNIVFVLGPVIAIAAVYFAFSVVSVVMALAPVGWLISIIFNSQDMLLRFFISLTMSGLGIIFSLVLMYVGKFLYSVILKYAKLNIRLIKGGNN